MVTTIDALDACAAVAKTLCSLKESDGPDWYLVYAHELEAAVRDARRAHCAEMLYISSLVGMAQVATDEVERNHLLQLAVHRLLEASDG